MSQNTEILSHLQSGQTLTPLEALQLFGCFRLAARIYNLRDDGHDVSVELVNVRGKQVAKYSMGQA